MIKEKNNRLLYKKSYGLRRQTWVNRGGRVKKDRLTSLCVSELIKLTKQGFGFCEEGSAIADNKIIKKAHYEGKYYLAAAIAERRIYEERIPFAKQSITYAADKARYDAEWQSRLWTDMGYVDNKEWEKFFITNKDGKKQKYINPPPSRAIELYIKRTFP
jgi:hypothetical protein